MRFRASGTAYVEVAIGRRALPRTLYSPLNRIGGQIVDHDLIKLGVLDLQALKLE